MEAIPRTSDNERIIPLLIGCLNQRTPGPTPADLQGLAQTDWDSLLNLASIQGVLPLLYQRLKECGVDSVVPGETWEQLKERYHVNAMRNIRLLAQLQRIATDFRAHDIPLMILKGPYLAEVVYGNIALRVMSDLDIMVPRNKTRQAADRMMALGFQPAKPFVVEADTAMSQHLTPFIGGSVAVEIHWNITRPDVAYSIKPDELWERAIPAGIPNMEILTLSPEDFLLHLCVHVSYQHRFEFGLRPSCDIAALVQHFSPSLDWTVIVARATRWGWARGVALTLRLAQDLTGARIPSHVYAELLSDGIDPTLLATAKAQVFTVIQTEEPFSPQLTRLKDEHLSLRGKIFLLFNSFFPSHAFLCQAYGIPPGSKRVILYYPRRWWDALRRNIRNAYHFFLSDKELNEVAGRRNTLWHWLHG